MQHTWFIWTAFVSVLLIQSHSNNKFSTCTHAVYSEISNQAFCDFWYTTQKDKDNELQLCDCKQNNGEYCTSWICAVISDYPFYNSSQGVALLNKILLPSNIEIFGVHKCGDFTDDILLSNNDTITQYCYKYNDFQSCFCVPDDDDKHCKHWICHQYLNTGKDDFSMDKDHSNPKYHNYWNISAQNDSSVVDMREFSEEMSDEEYQCTDVYSDLEGIVDIETCVQWEGTLVKYDGTFNSMSGGSDEWNSETSMFTYACQKQYSETSMFNSETCTIYFDGESNITIYMDDLVDTIVYKWTYDESIMSRDDFCDMCGNETEYTEHICNSISDVCGNWVVVDDAGSNKIIVIVGIVAGAIGCILCVIISAIIVKRRCNRGRYGFDSGYELSRV